MRLGIVTIGSLFWSPSRVRCRWRQNRLSCAEKRVVTVPIRYGRKSKKSGYSMVFAKSCAEAAKLGRGLVLPVCAECREPQHLLEEAEHLWAAECDSERISGICRDWGKVCVLKNPDIDTDHPVLQGWHTHVSTLGAAYTDLPTAIGEDPVLDPATGVALFEWPKDVGTNQDLSGFDILLMTANKPTLNAGQYPTAEEIALAWRADTVSNGRYFYNNRHCGITTFEDAAIQAVLQGNLADTALHATDVPAP